jgi:hypothetical protein
MGNSYLHLSRCMAGEDARSVVSAWAVSELRAIAGGYRPLQAVAHPLGFVCLPLERDGGDGVCLHFWSPEVPGGAGLTTSEIHAHSWQLTSIALLGRLWNDQMRVLDAAGTGAAEGTPEPLYRVLEIRSHGSVDELRPTTRIVTCQKACVTLTRAGDVYRLPAGVFHATRADPGTEAVTIALGKTVHGAPNEALGHVQSTKHQVPRRLIGVGETGKLAALIMGRLSGGRE